MPEFTRSLDELIPLLSKQKVTVFAHLKRNFKEGIHFIKRPHQKKIQRGGHNRIDILMTEETCELMKNSYNLRNKYITSISPNIKIILNMPIETQTIGFIQNSYIDSVESIRQFKFGKYTPGTKIKIISEKQAKLKKPDYFLVLPWHFKDSIINREVEFLKSGGKMIFPLPEIEII